MHGQRDSNQNTVPLSGPLHSYVAIRCIISIASRRSDRVIAHYIATLNDTTTAAKFDFSEPHWTCMGSMRARWH